MRETRPFLNVVVADQSKDPTLRKDSRVVVHRAGLETNHDMGYHFVFVNDLFEITCSKQLSLQSTERRNTVHRSLGIAYGYRFGRQGAVLQQNGNEQPTANHTG